MRAVAGVLQSLFGGIHLSDALVTGLLVGSFTLVGTFLTNRLQRGLDDRQADKAHKRQLVGAINTVLPELAANSVIITKALVATPPVGELPLSFLAYQRVELLLAEQLPNSAHQALFEAYQPLRAGDLYSQQFVASAQSEAQPVGWVLLDPTACKAQLARLQNAGVELRAFRDGLKKL